MTREEELLDLITNKKIGVGAYRTVYSLNDCDDYIIKVANGDDGEKENLRELLLWIEIKDCYPKLKKYFAPCLSCSDTGKYLLQKKVIFPDFKKYPKQLPSFFSDTKYQNFGLLNGKLVCIDFGCFNIRGSEKLKTVKWWDANI